MIQGDNSWMLLKHHPNDPAYFEAFHLEAKTTIAPANNVLKVSYRLTGPVSEILWPKEDAPGLELERDQKIWEHTCFELFLGTSLSPNYYEWNFSSTKKWGHFRFESYRKTEGDTLFPGGIQKIEFKREVNSANLIAEIDLSQLPAIAQALQSKTPLLVSATVILESKKGEKSHWAFSHQDSVPNFHQPSSFTAKIL